jgi:hypothetical protein
MADFELWSRENLVKFAQEAQERMEVQEKLIRQLHDAIEKLEQELKEKQ